MKKLFLLMFIITILGGCAPRELQNGTYKAEYKHFDSRGWKPMLSIIIKDQKIDTIMYKEINHSDEIKAKSESYAEAMKKKSGITPAEAEKKLLADLLAKQKTPVDSVTGATSLSKKFNLLSGAILKNAAAGETKTAYFDMDAVYSATEKEASPEGFKGEVKLTFKGGKLIKAEYYEINADKKKNTKGQAVRTEIAAELVEAGNPGALKGGTPEELARFKTLTAQVFKTRGM